ncbi:ABC transporter ATP-binding protein [Lentisalinibacter orientalis]|uniref:ABC transporter ATP-binding protein n=1 Tax=Lentisalinibacter orientalis TaxID=2992241 RepID=UPI003870272B
MKPILEVTGVSKSYGSATAVKDVSFGVGAGEVLTLLGRSGCGKSTTLRLVAGLESPDTGSISLRDRVVADVASNTFVPAEKRRIGLVFQSYAVWPHMTVAENIAYPLKVRRTSRAEIADKVSSVANLVGLHDYLHRPGTKLSGGQQQRVALARALVGEPDLLLLDEPFSNLDTELREELRHQMKAIQKRLNMSVLYVTHDQTEAMDLSDTVVVMYNGDIQQIGTPRQIYEEPANFFIQRFVGRIILLEGTVTSPGNDHVIIRLLEGIDIALPESRSDLTVGESVRVAVRPEDSRVSSEPSKTLVSIPATVSEVSYVGHSKECKVETGGNTNTVPLGKNERVKPGDRFFILAEPEYVTVWPKR